MFTDLNSYLLKIHILLKNEQSFSDLGAISKAQTHCKWSSRKRRENGAEKYSETQWLKMPQVW